MVPCPWFTEIAEVAASNGDLDLGVHLTLTSEKAHYRWRPISGPPPSAGLTDASGHMWRDVTSVRRHADPAAVEVELRAQVEAALAAGIDVTHLDAHMGTAMAPELCDIYLRLGADHALPVLLTGTLAGYGPSNHLAGVTEARVRHVRRPGPCARPARLRRGARDAVGPPADRAARTEVPRACSPTCPTV